MGNKHALSAALWHEFEQLRFKKTPKIQEKFGTFAVYWSYLQATASTQPAVVVVLDLVVCLG